MKTGLTTRIVLGLSGIIAGCVVVLLLWMRAFELLNQRSNRSVVLGSVLLSSTLVFVVATVYTVVNFICVGAAKLDDMPQVHHELQDTRNAQTSGGLFAVDETRSVANLRRQEKSFREEKEHYE